MARTALIGNGFKLWTRLFAGSAKAPPAQNSRSAEPHTDLMKVNERSLDSDLRHPAAWLLQDFGIQTHAAITATTRNIMTLAATFACVQKISRDMASLPCEVYKSTPEGGRTHYAEHPAYRLVHSEPNAVCTAFEFWEELIARACFESAGYAHITRNTLMRPVALRVVPSEDVTIYTSTDGMHQRYAIRGMDQMVEHYDMLRIPAFMGRSVVQVLNEVFGLSLTAQQYACMYFANGSQLRAFFTPDNPALMADPVKRQQLNESMRQVLRDKGSSIGVVPADGEFHEFKGPTMADAQALESRKYQGEEICRIFAVPPGLVGFETNTKYNSQEEQQLNYVTNCLRHWVKRVEQDLNKKLLYESEKDTVSFRFNLNALLRGNHEQRRQYYKDMLSIGAMSINEVRALEDLNPIDNGDLHLVQVNQITLDSMEQYSKKISATNEA